MSTNPSEAHGLNFKCAGCGGASKVIDSRGKQSGIRRRRECKRCHARWSTHEREEGTEAPSTGSVGLLRTKVDQMRKLLDYMEAVLRDVAPDAVTEGDGT